MKLFTHDDYERIRDKLIARASAQHPRMQLFLAPTYAKPGVGLWQAIGRMMGARKRAMKQPEQRSFPIFRPGMHTATYVREYYDLNGLNVQARPEQVYDAKLNRYVTKYTPMNYPDGFITMITRPAPIPAPDGEPITQPERKAA